MTDPDFWTLEARGRGRYRDDYGERHAIAAVELETEYPDASDDEIERRADAVARSCGHTCGGEITILLAGEPVTKTWRRGRDGWTSTPYPDVYRWIVRRTTAHDLDGLARELDLVAEHGAIVVRGRPLDDYGDQWTRRLARECTRTGDAPTFEPYADGLRWICVDVDGMPTEVDPAVDPDAYAADARRVLPDALARGRTYYQLSASAGIKPGARVHLWYWLERRAHDDALRAWADSVEHVDASLFGCVQPHYVAPPIFIGPAPDWGEQHLADPLPRRTGWLEGTPTVWPEGLMGVEKWRAFCELSASVARAATSSRAAAMWNDYARSDAGREARAAGAIRSSVDEILAAGEGARNHTICRKANFLGRVAAAGDLDIATARDALVEAARRTFGAQWSRRERGTLDAIERCLETGYQEVK